MRAGAPWVHLRDHDADEADFAEAARDLAARLRRQSPGDLRLSVNSRPEVALKLGAGLHTGRHGPTVEDARRDLGRDVVVGASAHDGPELVLSSSTDGEGTRPEDYGADYFFFSPVFPTSSKPGHPGAGLDALEYFCWAFPGSSVLALGGITPARVKSCLATSAHGVAVLSGILHADDPARATRQYLQALPSE